MLGENAIERHPAESLKLKSLLDFLCLFVALLIRVTNEWMGMVAILVFILMVFLEHCFDGFKETKVFYAFVTPWLVNGCHSMVKHPLLSHHS